MIINRAVPIRFIFHKIRTEIILLTIFSTLIYFLKNILHLWEVSMPLTIPAILGTAISLLLGFRTNQSYERWWEARKVWGGIVNDSRALLRLILTFTDAVNADDEMKMVIRKIGLRQIGWCYSLGRALRGLEHISEVKKYINEKELEEVIRHDNIPNALLIQHSRDINELYKKGKINKFQQIEIEGIITRLCDYMGMSERIKNTVFPGTYSLFIHIFLYLFIFILPFGLIDQFGLVEIPLVTAIGTAFFLIEKTAIQMQDPFENRPTDTSVTAISRTIEINLRQMIKDSEVPEKIKPESFYIL
ncbi:MAG: bestrophin family protein [Cytophagaceae bacterium]